MNLFKARWNDDSWNKLCRQYLSNDVDAIYDCYIKWLDESPSANKETTERSNYMPTDIRRLIKNVKFNPPATIVFWTDNTKTVVKCNGDDYDPEKGLAMCICKKMLGNKGNYYEVFKKWLPKSDDSDATQKALQHIEPKEFKFKLGLDNFNEKLFKTFTSAAENAIKFEKTKEKTECLCYTCKFYDKDGGCMNKKRCFFFDKWAHKDE